MESGRNLTGESTKRGRAVRLLVEYPRAVPVAIFFAIISITAFSVYAIESVEAEQENALMREAAHSIAASLERRGDASSAYLRAGAALFSSTDTVDLPLFRRFVSGITADATYRGADGIGWAEVIEPGDVDEFESRAWGERAQGTQIHPAPPPDQDRVVPVTFLEPESERNLRALGFDMYSEEVRREAMEEAERSVAPTASGKIVLVQEGSGDAPGFIIYMPVFGGAAGDRLNKGFVYSPFNAQQFLDSAIEATPIRGMGVRLYDAGIGAGNLMASRTPTFASGHLLTQEVRIANRPLLLQVESSRSGALSPLSMATLLFGLALASLLMLLARMLSHQAREDEAALEFFEQQNSIRNSLTRELNHRVKNTLANVLSIMTLTRRRSCDLDEFADGLEARIRALSATHSLLTQSEWGTTPVRSVIGAEVAPYASDSDTQVELSGVDVELAPNDALSLGMAIHELATNAAKYGALSVPGGKVSIDWALETDKLAVVHWRESGGPPVSPLREPGFGMELIEKIVAHELKHPVDLRFAEEGVQCTLRVPVRVPREFQMRARNYDPQI